MDKEIWKPIIIEKNEVLYDFTGMYEVSNYGRVRSLDRYIDTIINGIPCKRKIDRKILKPSKNKNGYLTVYLCKNGNSVRFYLHRLVATIFIDNPNNYSDVNHKDFDKCNNSIDNLEWVSHKENVQHFYNDEDKVKECKRKMKMSKAKKDNKHPRARAVICVETGQIFETLTEASAWCNGNRQNIYNCCNDKQTIAYGYHWKYAD